MGGSGVSKPSSQLIELEVNVINKPFKAVTILLLVVSIVFSLPQSANAEEDLTITRWLVDSEILRNGDLEISEDITFRFNREFNGVFREIILKGTDRIENIGVSEVIKGREVEYVQVDEAKEGDSNVYIVHNEDGTVNIQIFSPSEDEEKTFRIRYTIKNVSVRYNDIGELYYKFLGEDNETPVDFFGVNIRLPGNITENTKIFAHGPTNGTIKFYGENSIRAEVDNVPDNTFVEVRVLFPAEYIPDSTNVVNRDAYEEIMDEELSYIEEIKEREIRKAERKNLLNNISIISSAALTLIVFLIFNKYRRRLDILESIERSIYPDDNSPAVVSLVLNGTYTSSAFMATILDLARREFISIEEIEQHKEDTPSFNLIKLDKPADSLLEHEKYLLKWLFNEIGYGNKVSTIDIELYRKNQAPNFYKGHTQWTRLVGEEARKMGYYDNRTKKIGILLMLISIAFLAVSIFSLAYGALYGMLLIVVTIASFIYSIALLVRKSDYGYIQMKKWKDFRRDLERRSKSLDVNDLWISLDKALIYGLALGIPYDSLKRFKTLYPQSHGSNYWAYWFFLTNSTGDNLFTKSMNDSFNITGPSTGGGGSFSAGGGGGAGGGGAGGF